MVTTYDLEVFSRPTPEGSGWYVLRGGGNWASIEGDGGQWAEIAEAMRARLRRQFKRVAVAGAGPGFAVTLWSPRNAIGANDHVELTAAEADALADRIVVVLRQAGEPCLAAGE